MSSQIVPSTLDTHPVRIGEVEITQIAHGLFCINDLHRAAGGEARHQPSFFLRRKETDEILAALNSENPQSINVITVEGRHGGTYVCKDLVYDYAMWISPVFRLRVIRAFDAVAAGQRLALAPQFTRKELLRLALEQEEQLEEQQRQLVAQAPKVEGFERLLAADDTLSLRDAAKAAKVPEKKLVAFLLAERRLYRDEAGRLRAYAAECEAGRFTHRPWTAKHSKKPKAGVQVRVTTTGLAWISSRTSVLQRGNEAS